MSSTNSDLIPVTAAGLQAGDRDGSLGAGRRVVSARTMRDGRVEVVLGWTRSRSKATTRLEPDRTFRVKRVTVGPGMPVRSRIRSPFTRGTVELLDAAHPDSKVGRVDGSRWVLRCEHGTLSSRPTLEGATDAAPDPQVWCSECVALGPAALTLPLV